MAEKAQKVFEVKGIVTIGGQKKQFSKKTRAFNSKNALERVLTLFGSKNRLKRKNIQVMEVIENG